MNNKKRHTCIICNKKRYAQFMGIVPFLKTNTKYDELTKHWICIYCKEDYIKKLSSQVGQIKKIIRLLSTGVDLK